MRSSDIFIPLNKRITSFMAVFASIENKKRIPKRILFGIHTFVKEG
jgi:hypothetical protein